jgi:cation:H+ antiporter
VAILLFGGYLFYLYLTVKGESAELEEPKTLYLLTAMRKLGRCLSCPAPLLLILLQLALALILMIYGAQLFVDALGRISVHFGFNPLIFSLLLAPVATELPEKFNSITWTLRKKDALALGNITGAMVFQSTFPVSVGLLFTSWHVTGMALFSALLALVSATLALIALRTTNKLSPVIILCGGLLYFVYIIGLVLKGAL